MSGNDNTRIYEVDSDGRIALEEWNWRDIDRMDYGSLPDVTRAADYDGDGDDDAVFAYDYLGTGDLAGYTRTENGGAYCGAVWLVSGDGLSTTLECKNGVTDAVERSGTATWDAEGRLLTATFDPTGDGSSATTRTFTYNADGLVASVDVDFAFGGDYTRVVSWLEVTYDAGWSGLDTDTLNGVTLVSDPGVETIGGPLNNTRIAPSNGVAVVDDGGTPRAFVVEEFVDTLASSGALRTWTYNRDATDGRVLTIVQTRAPDSTTTPELYTTFTYRYDCDGGADRPWQWIVIEDTTSNPTGDGLGADINAVYLQKNGGPLLTDYFTLAGAPAGGGEWGNLTNLDEHDDPFLCSNGNQTAELGGAGGVLAVQMRDNSLRAVALQPDDVVQVYEVGPATCSDTWDFGTDTCVVYQAQGRPGDDLGTFNKELLGNCVDGLASFTIPTP